MTVAAPRPTAPASGPLPAAEPEGSGAGWRHDTLELVVAMAAVVVGGWGFHAVFATWGTFVAPVGLAAVAACLVAVLASRFRVPARFAVLLSAVAAVLFLSYTVLVSTLAKGVVPGRATLLAVRDGVLHGWSTILGGALPTRDETPALVFAVALSWIAGHLTTELVRRTRQVATVAVPALALYAITVPLTAPIVGTQWPLAVAVLTLALVALLVRARPERSLSRRRVVTTELHNRTALGSRLGLGLPVIAVAVVVGAAVAALALAGRDPYDPRELRDEQVSSALVNDPLAEFKAIRARSTPSPDVQIRLPSSDDALEAQRLSLVTLDRFDGTRWLSSDRFAQVSGADLLGATGTPKGREVDYTMDLVGLPGSWLPTLGTPTSVSLRDVGVDRGTGDVLVSGRANGITVRTTSRLSTPSEAEIRSAVAASGTAFEADRLLSRPAPSEITALAQEWTSGATTAGDALTRIQSQLQTTFGYSDDLPGGHSYGRLVRFVTQDRRGNAEQFATTFAVMARSLGYPARVVVGYKLTETKDGKLQALTFLRPEHYHAWAEVALDGLGWVAFDPTPASGTNPVPPKAQQPTGTSAPQDGGGNASRAPQEAGPTETPPSTSTARGFARLLGFAALGVAGLVAIAGAVVLVVLGLKRLRRSRRRRAGDAASSVVGAWDEVLDRLVESDVVATTSMTPNDVCAAATERLGAAATLPLYPLANDVARAIYSARTPSPQLAERAWRRADDFAQNLTSLRTRRERLRALADPRPLRRRA